MKTFFTLIAAGMALATASVQAASFLDMNEQQKNFYGKNFQQCQDELTSLGKLNGSVYQANKAELDDNVNRATRYLLLRPTLPADITAVMDSVHQANIARVCQQIRQDLYAALLKEAEGSKQ
ncbi:MAG: hypothetical protein ACRC5A_11455 [Enterobacteriaceae bacterium]